MTDDHPCRCWTVGHHAPSRLPLLSHTRRDLSRRRRCRATPRRGTRMTNDDRMALDEFTPEVARGEQPCRCIAAGEGGTHWPSDHLAARSAQQAPAADLGEKVAAQALAPVRLLVRTWKAENKNGPVWALVLRELDASIKAGELRTAALLAPTEAPREGGLTGLVCTDPDCTIKRKPGFPMHGPHDFRAGVRADSAPRDEPDGGA